MSRQKFTLVLEIDAAVLTVFDLGVSPPPLAFDTWDASALPYVVEKGLYTGDLEREEPEEQ